MPTAALGLRERKKLHTRQLITEAALTLAVERGPSAFTVEDIADAAGVSCRTVFNYFPTKEAAIVSVDPQRRREVLEELASRPADETPVEALRQALCRPDRAASLALRTRAALVRAHPQLQSAYLASLANLDDDLVAVLSARLPDELAVGLYPRLVVAICLAAMRAAIDDAIATGNGLDASVDRAFDALATGLAPRLGNSPRRRPRSS